MRDHFQGVISRIQHETIGQPNFELILGRVSAKDYHGLLSGAELAVMTHRQEHYRNMESGLANDCLRLDTPCLVRRGTLTARNLAAYGGRAFSYAGDHDIVAAMANLLSNRARTTTDFERCARRYRPCLEYPAI